MNRDDIDQRLSAAELAALLTEESKQTITEKQVTELAERGELIAEDGKISLLEYTAYLIQEYASGN